MRFLLIEAWLFLREGVGFKASGTVPPQSDCLVYVQYRDRKI